MDERDDAVRTAPAPAPEAVRDRRDRHGLRSVLAVLAAAVLLLVSARAVGLSDPAYEGDGWVPLYVEAGEPIRWDSCRPVRYVLRTEGAPPGAAEMVSRAVAQVAAATGLEFVHDGPTDEVPRSDREAVLADRYGDGWAPVLIAWSDEDESSHLEGDAVGVAGPIADDPDGRGWRLITGDVLLDGPDLAGDEEETFGVLLHELGHLMGLDHVDDPADTMHPDAQVTQVFTPGALRGLAVLGDGPCFG